MYVCCYSLNVLTNLAAAVISLYVISVIYVEIMFRVWTGSGNNWCVTSVEFYWIDVGTGVEMRTVTSGRNFQISVGTRCLWCVVEVGCAVEGRGRFVRGVWEN